MCHFLSFFVSVKENKLVVGDPTSHSNAPVHSAISDFREAEWIEDKLTIRVADGEDLNAYKATVFAKAKTLKDLCKLLSPSKDKDGNTFYFNEFGYHRENGPAVEWANGYKA